MFNRFSTRIRLSLLAVVWMASGCGWRGPSAPSVPTVTTVTPNSGSTRGATRVTIYGTGFQAGAIVTLDGAAATGITVLSASAITATTPAHAGGAVDVAVTNPNGQDSRLTAAYTFVSPAAVTAVSPNIGSTVGGTPVTITGTTFLSGATVTFNGIAATNRFVATSTTIYATAPAHLGGTVDVVVVNPDGEIATFAGGYTYASPQSFDFNGTWQGNAGSEGEFLIRFVIQNNSLASVSCHSSTFTFPTPLTVTNGEFSFSREDGVRMSGRIVSPSSSIGAISVAPDCIATTWFVGKLNQ